MPGVRTRSDEHVPENARLWYRRFEEDREWGAGRCCSQVQAGIVRTLAEMEVVGYSTLCVDCELLGLKKAFDQDVNLLFGGAVNE